MPRSDAAGGTALQPASAPLRAVAGLPSFRSIFAYHTMADVLRRAGGVTTRGFNRADQAGLGDGPALLYCDVPDSGAATALADAGAACFVVREGFADAVRYSMAARGMTGVEAARFVSLSAAALDGLERICAPRPITVPLDWPIGQWIDHAAGLAGVAPADWAAARAGMHAVYAPYGTVGAAVRAIVQHADACLAPDPADEAGGGGAIAALASGYDGPGRTAIEWPAAMLLGAVPPYEPVTGALDLTGPARVLTFGPYLHLPAGRWSATYRFETWGNEATNALGFDVVADGEVKFSTQGVIDVSGQFGVECAFTVSDALRPVEFRCFLVEGAIGGFLRPGGVSLRRIGDAQGAEAAHGGVPVPRKGTH